MAKIRITPGVCGMTTVVNVKQKEDKAFCITVESQCETVKTLSAALPPLTPRDAFKKITENPIYEAASSCLQHVACPVPCGILKAFEVEAGVAVAKNIHMEFVSEDEEES
jgi:hypothetical protein